MTESLQFGEHLLAGIGALSIAAAIYACWLSLH